MNKIMRFNEEIEDFRPEEEINSYFDRYKERSENSLKTVKGHWFSDTFKQDIFDKLESDGLNDNTLFKLVDNIDSETAIKIHNILFKK